MRSVKQLVSGLFILAIVTFSSHAQAARVLPGPLVDTTWLAANLHQVVVIEIGNGSAGAAAFAAGHVPGAVFVDFAKVRATRVIDGVTVTRMIPLAENFQAVMRTAGIHYDDPVVITFAGETTDDVTFATRLYWTLKYFGHDDVALLDGGKAQWVRAGLPLSTVVVAPFPGDFVAFKEEADMYATTAEVADAIDDAKIQLVDVRPLPYYLGLETKSDYVYAPGHVPTAKNAPLELLFAAKAPLTFLSPEQITASLQAVGVNPQGANIAVCNSGHTASGLWFVLHELLGNKRSELYDGSMHEWTIDPNRPVATMRMD